VPAGTGTSSGGSPEATPVVPTDCYTSNPPSSGRHLGSLANVDIGGGIIIPRFPPERRVFDPDVAIPRDGIPHILEHAGVFVAYNCAEDDQGCQDVVDQLTGLANDRIDNHGDRVVMARDTDLPVGTIGLAAWTRVMNMPYQDYDEDAISDFIGTHSCRFDPENFCR
jgi:hypothetical protein